MFKIFQVELLLCSLYILCSMWSCIIVQQKDKICWHSWAFVLWLMPNMSRMCSTVRRRSFLAALSPAAMTDGIMTPWTYLGKLLSFNDTWPSPYRLFYWNTRACGILYLLCAANIRTFHFLHSFRRQKMHYSTLFLFSSLHSDAEHAHNSLGFLWAYLPYKWHSGEGSRCSFFISDRGHF